MEVVSRMRDLGRCARLCCVRRVRVGFIRASWENQILTEKLERYDLQL